MAGTGNQPDDVGFLCSGEYEKTNYLHCSNSGVFSLSSQVFCILRQIFLGKEKKKVARGDESAVINFSFFVSLESRKSLKMLPPNGKMRCGGVVCRNTDPKPRFIHRDARSRDGVFSASEKCPNALPAAPQGPSDTRHGNRHCWGRGTKMELLSWSSAELKSKGWKEYN